MFAFDVADVDTFEGMKKWLEQTKAQISDGVPVALVATKCDLGEEHEEVQSERLEDLVAG